MLDIVASYHGMQCQRKLMNHAWENGQKPHFRTDLGPLGSNSGSEFIFSLNIWFRQTLEIMVSYHAQYQKKLMIQSWENLVTEGQADGRTRVIS